MCIGTELSSRALAKYKAESKKRGYIRVWKRVLVEKHWGFVSYVNGYLYGRGLLHFHSARSNAAHEDQLIHAYRWKTEAQFHESEIEETVQIECLVKPEWVMAISSSGLTTKAIVMPRYPKTKVTIAEFRKAVKGKKVHTYSWEN